MRALVPPAAALLLAVASSARADPPPAAPRPADSGPAAAAPRWISPADDATRAATRTRLGGGAAVEQALAAGVDWLVRHQGENGLWDGDGFPSRCAPGGPACDGKGKGQHGEEIPCPFDEALSALAAQALLALGTRPGAEGASGQALERALERLAGTHDVWAAPLTLEALAEAEVLEGKGRWTAAVGALAKRLLAARQDDGAWGYVAPGRPGSDVPCTALVVPALLAARDVGVTLPDDLGPRIDAWLGTLEEDEGRLAYLEQGRRYGYTPTSDNAHAAFALRELLETGTEGTRHRAHVGLALRKAPSWSISFRELEVPGRGRQRVQVGSLSMFAWWLGTRGAWQRGGSAWSTWWPALKGALVPHQRKDGCARGSFDPLGTYERQTGGRVLATALAVQMLAEPGRRLRLAASRAPAAQPGGR